MVEKRPALGKGLSALIPDAPEPRSTSFEVDIDQLEPNRLQPRAHPEAAALDDLARSIKANGIIQPIVVRKVDGGYQIIAGERRWRASRLAGLREVPVRIIEADDRRAMELALVENLQREDLNPIEEAKGYRTLIDEYGMTQEEASQSVGKSRPSITNALRLLNLTPPVMAMLEDGDISAGHARALLSIKDEADQLRVATKVVEESLSVRQTENLAVRLAEQAEKSQKQAPAHNPLEVDYIADTEKQLTSSLGRKIMIKDSGKKGRIELEYYGTEDREALIAALLQFGNAGGRRTQ